MQGIFPNKYYNLDSGEDDMWFILVECKNSTNEVTSVVSSVVKGAYTICWVLTHATW